MIPACSTSDRFAICFIPDAAGTICRPCGPVTMASSSEHSPLTTCPRWYRVCSPSITSTLANPKSASSSMTSRPWAAIDTARLADTVVLPTPPLPPVTAIALTGREELSSASSSARSRDNRVSRMGGRPPEVADKVGLVAYGGLGFLHLKRGAHQPDSFAVRCMQILRHLLPVADVGDFQLMAQSRRYHGAQARRLVHLGRNAGDRGQRRKGLHDLFQRVGLALRGKRQQDPRARSAELQRRELLAQPDVVRTHARGVDEYQFFRFQLFQHPGQVLAAVRGVHRRAADAWISEQLGAGGDAVTLPA